jgi:hypothetical protein
MKLTARFFVFTPTIFGDFSIFLPNIWQKVVKKGGRKPSSVNLNFEKTDKMKNQTIAYTACKYCHPDPTKINQIGLM